MQNQHFSQTGLPVLLFVPPKGGMGDYYEKDQEKK